MGRIVFGGWLLALGLLVLPTQIRAADTGWAYFDSTRVPPDNQGEQTTPAGSCGYGTPHGQSPCDCQPPSTVAESAKLNCDVSLIVDTPFLSDFKKPFDVGEDRFGGYFIDPPFVVFGYNVDPTHGNKHTCACFCQNTKYGSTDACNTPICDGQHPVHPTCGCKTCQKDHGEPCTPCGVMEESACASYTKDRAHMTWDCGCRKCGISAMHKKLCEECPTFEDACPNGNKEHQAKGCGCNKCRAESAHDISGTASVSKVVVANYAAMNFAATIGATCNDCITSPGITDVLAHNTGTLYYKYDDSIRFACDSKVSISSLGDDSGVQMNGDYKIDRKYKATFSYSVEKWVKRHNTGAPDTWEKESAVGGVATAENGRLTCLITK